MTRNTNPVNKETSLSNVPTIRVRINSYDVLWPTARSGPTPTQRWAGVARQQQDKLELAVTNFRKFFFAAETSGNSYPDEIKEKNWTDFTSEKISINSEKMKKCILENRCLFKVHLKYLKRQCLAELQVQFIYEVKIIEFHWKIYQ